MSGEAATEGNPNIDTNYWSKGIGRRGLLRGASVGAAGLAGAALLGCGGGSSSPAAATPAASGTATSAAAASGQPKPGGIAKYAARPDTTHLDVSRDSSLAALMTGSTMYSQLLRYDANKLPNERVISSDLAEKWEVANGGQQFTFHLRKGVTFHDGKPMTSADVSATMERAKKVHPFRDLMKPITAVETPDDSTVVFKTAEPCGYLVEFLTSPISAIMPKHIITVDDKALSNNPVGTGPFKFESWNKGVGIKVRKNPNYYLKGFPYLDGIDFTQTADLASEVNGLRTGQIQVSMQSAGITPDQVKQIQADVPGVLVRNPGTTTIEAVFLNNSKAPFNDVRVRRAVSNTIDQQTLINLNKGGSGGKMGYILGSGLSDEQRKKAIPGYAGITEANIAEAKKLLDAAGFKNGLTVDYKTGQSDPTKNDNYLSVYTQQFAKAGIKLNPTIQKYPDEIFGSLDKQQYEAGMVAWIFAMINPVSFLQVNVTGNTGNRNAYSNKDYDALYKKLLATADPKEIQDLAVQMENILVQEVPWVPGLTPRYNNIIRPEIGGYTGPAYLRDYFDQVQVYLK